VVGVKDERPERGGGVKDERPDSEVEVKGKA
jgi:hypothetical protein